MTSCPLLEFCKCDGATICLVCKILAVIVVAILSGILGYSVGKRRTSKPRAEGLNWLERGVPRDVNVENMLTPSRQEMYKSLEPYIHLYIAKINTKKYLENTKQFLLKEKLNKQNILGKMEIEKVGNKLNKDLELSEKLIIKYETELKEAQSLYNQFPDGVNIGTLLSIFYGNDALALLSGMDNYYRAFNPKYAMYDQHIKDAIKDGYKYSNFYGIPGDLSKDNPDYGIYEFKKGFGGEVCELIGEFDLITNKAIYSLYKLAIKAYAYKKKLKK